MQDALSAYRALRRHDLPKPWEADSPRSETDFHCARFTAEYAQHSWNKDGHCNAAAGLSADKCQEDEILIAVTDFDGHTHVEGNAWMTKPKNLIHWATQLLSTWRMGASNRFVLPVMWDDADTTFYLPLEAGYCQKLRIIP
jgi:hypothetical protein